MDCKQVPDYQADPTRAQAALRVQTLGGFRVWCEGTEILPTAWGREKAIHLFQFFITMRRQFVHKEQIIDRLWPDMEIDKGDRDFKVALNALNRALEPHRGGPHAVRADRPVAPLAPDVGLA